MQRVSELHYVLLRLKKIYFTLTPFELDVRALFVKCWATLKLHMTTICRHFSY
eukprot:jgi/Phyca11/511527/fgenesh2_kg.PHYCAscaffold_87_\